MYDARMIRRNRVRKKNSQRSMIPRRVEGVVHVRGIETVPRSWKRVILPFLVARDRLEGETRSPRSSEEGISGDRVYMLLPAYSGSIVAQRATLEFQRRRRLPTAPHVAVAFVVFVGHGPRGARPRNSRSGSGLEEKRISATPLTPGSCVDYSLIGHFRT